MEGSIQGEGMASQNCLNPWFGGYGRISLITTSRLYHSSLNPWFCGYGRIGKEFEISGVRYVSKSLVWWIWKDPSGN